LNLSLPAPASRPGFENDPGFLTENWIALNLKPEVLSWKIAIVGIKNSRVFEENNNYRI
jgi:hypothetical protein